MTNPVSSPPDSIPRDTATAFAPIIPQATASP